MQKYFYLAFPVEIIIFILSCIKNIILCRLVFAIFKGTKNVEVNIKKKIIGFACLSDVIAFFTAYLILMTKFNTGFAEYFDIENILLLCAGTITSASITIKCIGVFIGMLSIFFFDYFVVFRNWADVSKKHKLLLSIVFAVINAPYFFLFDVKSIIYNCF